MFTMSRKHSMSMFGLQTDANPSTENIKSLFALFDDHKRDDYFA